MLNFYSEANQAQLEPTVDHGTAAIAQAGSGVWLGTEGLGWILYDSSTRSKWDQEVLGSVVAGREHVMAPLGPNWSRRPAGLSRVQ